MLDRLPEGSADGIDGIIVPRPATDVTGRAETRREASSFYARC